MRKQQRDAAQIHEQIQVAATRNADARGGRPKVQIIDSIAIGQAVREGDIYVHRVASDHPRGKPRKSRQLAIGETRGSRHVAEAPAQVFEGVARPPWCGERTFLGPFFVVAEGQRGVVTHPEHDHFNLPPGCYQVTHQMDARTLDRVQD